MGVTIYAYNDSEKIVQIPDSSEIVGIQVKVISSDEVVDFFMKDGSVIHADSSDNRFWDYHDDSYVVFGEEIQNWINWKNDGNLKSYERAKKFGLEEDEE